MKIISLFIKFLNRLKFVHKFFIISCFIAIPIVLLTALLFSNINENITAMKKREAGAEYNLLLKDLLQEVQQHRGLSVMLVNGNGQVKKDLTEKRQAISSIFEKINSSDADERMQAIYSEWLQVEKMEQWRNAKEVIDEHEDITNELLNLIERNANDSGLLLAESKEEYKLIYSMTATIPKLTENLGVMRARGIEATYNKNISESEENELTNLYYSSTQLLEMMKSDMLIIFENAQYQNIINDIYQQSEEKSQQYLQVINKEFLNKSTIGISTNDFYVLATAAINDAFQLYNDGMTLLVDSLQEELKRLENQKTMTMIVIAISLILTALFYHAFYLAIKKSIHHLQTVAADVANGNLAANVHLDTKDEMKEIEVSMNQMIKNLHTLVKKITESSEQVAASSEELTASSQETTGNIELVSSILEEVTSSTNTQANSIERSTNSVIQISSGIEKIFNNNSEISKLANETMSLSIDGDEAVSETYEQMKKIQTTVSDTSKLIQLLHNHSAEIGRANDLINSIGEQTHLLALNATIEAARSGEHGKGFAVVANEVRKLAEQSKSSATTISQLIKAIQNDIKNTVDMMVEVNHNVDKGLAVTKATADKFSHILQKMNDLVPKMNAVTSVSKDISLATNDVEQQMKEIRGITNIHLQETENISASTEEQLAAMEEINAAAASLTNMANELQDLIKKFQL